MSRLLESPLRDRHESLGAKLADFGGWNMPIEYPASSGGGVLAEHQAVRNSVGIFDVSHMGKALVRGQGAKEYVNSCFTNDLEKVSSGKAQYTLCCDESGGVVDDLIQYLRSDQEVFLIPNASNCDEVVRRLKSKAPAGVEVSGLQKDFGIVAVQGPLAKEAISAIGLVIDLEYMSFSDSIWQSPSGKEIEIIICRTGYTGEFGFEIVVPWSATGELWDALMQAIAPLGGKPCGLGARDTLRTEMGYPLHGHELSLDISPIQAGASWAVVLDKQNFWGKSALVAEKERGPYYRLRAIKSLDRGIPRADMEVQKAGGVVGRVTSGTFSPTLKIGIGLALLNPEIAVGDRLSIDVRGRVSEFEVVKIPFVESHVK